MCSLCALENVKMKRARSFTDSSDHQQRLDALGLATSGEATLVRSSSGDTSGSGSESHVAPILPPATIDGWPLDLEFWHRYDRLRLLGQGVSSSVFLVRRHADGQLFALKVFRASHRGLADNERDVLLRLRQLETATQAPTCPPSIVCYVAHMMVLDQTTLLPQRALLMTYVEGADVDKINWSITSGVIAPAIAHRLIVSALEGLAYVHGRHIAHRDLKPANVRVTTGVDQLVIMDFGVACGTVVGDVPISCATDRRVAIGSPCYFSPELTQRYIDMRHGAPFVQNEADKVAMALAGDVWALGATCYTLLATTHRWPMCNLHSIEDVNERLHAADLLPSAEELYAPWPALAALVLRMLTQNAALRPTAQQLLDEARTLLVPGTT